MNIKVIATSCASRQTRGQPITYPDHMQSVDGVEDTKRMLQDLVDFEQRNDSGCPLDIMIVNNSIGNVEFDQWVEGLQGETRWGQIGVITRSNVGWSFGAYNEAYQIFKNDYNYWLFTEDDIFVGSENYFARLIEKWSEDKFHGFISLIRIINHSFGTHCAGGVGFTSSKILEKLNKRRGFLPHHNAPDNMELDFIHRKSQIIQQGEVPFTNEILKMGYDLISFSDQKDWNLEKNLCIPYFNLHG